EPLDRGPGPASTDHGIPHLAPPIHPLICLMQVFDHWDQGCIPTRTSTTRTGFGRPVPAWGDEPTVCRTQNTTDGLDPETIPEHIDICDHLVVGRSSSAAKNADAVFKISLARRSSAFSRLSLRISARASVGTPDFLPVSTSACSTHRRNVSVAILSFGAVWRITVYRLGA